MATPGVNIRILRAEIGQQAKGKIAPRAERAIQKEFRDFKRDLIREFDEDEVTQELEAGPEASSSLVVTDHGGNLFSLLGFNSNDNPVKPLRDYLSANIILDSASRVKMKNGEVIIDKRVEIPTLAEMEDVAQSSAPLDDWTSSSWLRLLHRGIPWFSSYLYDPEKFNDKYYSRSGAAIEAKDRKGNLIRVRSGSQRPIPYINRLLAKFKARIVATRRK